MLLHMPLVCVPMNGKIRYMFCMLYQTLIGVYPIENMGNFVHKHKCVATYAIMIIMFMHGWGIVQ